MFGLKERPYPGHLLIFFWCDFDNKNFDFLMFQNFSRYFSFAHLPPPFVSALTRKPLLGLFLNICSIPIGPEEFAW